MEKKRGLVMEGGSMRGLFTCGVIDVLMEEGIEMDGAVGVSAGAAFGCNVKSKQIGRGIRYNKKLCQDKRYASWGNFFRTGNMFDVEFCYHDVPFVIDPMDMETYEKNPMEFFCVATDIRTGKAHYEKLMKGTDRMVQWIRASASVPLVTKPVEIDGELYLDGGIADSIPLQFLEKEGYEKIIVIETQPKDYVKKPQQYMGLVKMSLRKYPNMIKAMKDRYLMYNEEKAYIRKQEEAGKVLVIRPDEPLGIPSICHDPEEEERVYQLGRKKGKEVLDAVKQFWDVKDVAQVAQ
ncbi:MAG: patatin family protein [Lachnospiraceae bacterium]|nr:patatin family protein [Lachnospiraceae bacterium]